MTAPPTPSGEAPDLREAVARTIRGAISADGPCWIDANIADAIIAEHIAPLRAENESLRAELSKVATVVRSAAMGEWTDSFEAMVEESCAWEARVRTAEAQRDAAIARAEVAERALQVAAEALGKASEAIPAMKWTSKADAIFSHHQALRALTLKEHPHGD